jgi:hypothetical protein
MREILFRGKNIYNDWIYGYLCQHRGEPVMDNNGMVLKGSDYYIRDWEEKIDTGFYGCNYKVFPSTVGQYTGLTDKNGKKVFEGDCFKTYCTGLPVYKHIVGYYPEHFAFMARCIETNVVHYLSDYRPSAIEVIGNIHDNPELLEADK